MKFEINFTELPEYVYIQTEGKASVSGFRELLTALVENPAWTTGAKQIVDHRKLETRKLTSEDMWKIKDIVETHAKKLGYGYCAFVVKETLGYAFSRMYELIGGDEIHQKVKVFYAIDEAAKWLEIKNPQIR